VAISDGIVTAVGRIDGPAHRTLDADGLLVTPGFVDIHAHYDGQASWGERMIPSSWHGSPRWWPATAAWGSRPSGPPTTSASSS
jgi:N-acyl-D-aspartate/D-glutamate deacylase